MVGGSVALVAFMGSGFTDIGPWYEALPPIALQPPKWLFGPVWSTLFFLIAWAGVIIANSKNKHRNLALYLFGVNGVLNIYWTILFFTLRDIPKAMVEIAVLWFTIIFMIVASSKVDKKAAWLLAPYLIWVSFATYLNYAYLLATAGN